MRKASFPETDCMLLKECVKAAKAASKRGMRYHQDWLLLCLLLHIRTSSGYRFLRENNILPLPSVKTIRKYLAMVGMQCGFDADFFEASRKGTLSIKVMVLGATTDP
ncbi:hypothetical protein HPB49_017123 [Dermacentor silvarum]|uniref:Uncharacterized protein n=1 Tax=Dermacentor silvarum TaxID=543639 RepID=A0ACB8CYP2_DERSI|nr:hypothetical protein HPB49_017123 [Dermacentor silvarum]